MNFRLVSVNGRFIKSYSEGQEILHEEINTLHAKQILKLRILIGKTSEEIEMESRVQEELLRYKNALYYATNFYSLAQDTHQKHHYQMSLQYLHKAYQLASTSTSSASLSSSSSPSSSPSLPLIKRLFKLMACCRELQGMNYLSLGQDIHAIEYFQETIQLRQQIYENEFHFSIYKSIDTLSRIYRRHSIFSQSLFYAQLLIDLCHQNHLQHSSQMANAISNLAKIKRSQLLLNDSFLLEIESFQLRVMIFGSCHESIGMSLLAIGKIKQALGDLGNGTEEIYQKAIKIYQKLIQSTSPSAAVVNGHGHGNVDSPPKRRNSLNPLPPLPSISSMNSLHNQLGDVYSSLSSFERERKNFMQAEQYKLQEISSRQSSKHLSRALLEAYWEFNQLIDSESGSGLLTHQDRSSEAYEYRVKAINGMKRMYGEKNKRMMKMIKEHEKKSKNFVMVTPKGEEEQGGVE
jgi:tetratricopeptide (TPR) repeat protein